MKSIQKDITTVMLCFFLVLKINLWSISIHFADLDTLICKENDGFPGESTCEGHGPWEMTTVSLQMRMVSQKIYLPDMEGDYHKMRLKI